MEKVKDADLKSIILYTHTPQTHKHTPTDVCVNPPIYTCLITCRNHEGEGGGGGGLDDLVERARCVFVGLS